MKTFKLKLLKSPAFVSVILLLTFMVIFVVILTMLPRVTPVLFFNLFVLIVVITRMVANLWYVVVDDLKLTIGNRFFPSSNKVFDYNSIEQLIFESSFLTGCTITIRTSNSSKAKKIILSLVDKRDIKVLIENLKLKDVEINVDKLSDRYK